MNYQELINNSVKSRSGKYYIRNVKKLVGEKPNLDTYYDLLLHTFNDVGTMENICFLLVRRRTDPIDLFCPDNLFDLLPDNWKENKSPTKVATVYALITTFEHILINQTVLLYLFETKSYTFIQILNESNRLPEIKLKNIIYSCKKFFTKSDYNELINFFLENNFETNIDNEDIAACILKIDIPHANKLFDRYYNGWTEIYKIELHYVDSDIIEWIKLLINYNYAIELSFSIFYWDALSDAEITYICNNSTVYFEENRCVFDSAGRYSEVKLNIMLQNGITPIIIPAPTDTDDTVKKMLLIANKTDAHISYNTYTDDINLLKRLINISKEIGVDISKDLDFQYSIFFTLKSVDDIKFIYLIYGIEKLREHLSSLLEYLVCKLLCNNKSFVITYMISNGFPEILEKTFNVREYSENTQPLENTINDAISIGLKLFFNINKIGTVINITEIVTILKLHEKYPENIFIKYTHNFVDFGLHYSKVLDFYSACIENNLEFKYKTFFADKIKEINRYVDDYIESMENGFKDEYVIKSIRERMKLINTYTDLVADGKLIGGISKNIMHKFYDNLEIINRIIN